MAAPPSIIDPFHRQIFEVLAEDIDKRMTSLASGSAGSHDEYRYQVGYIEALTRVLDTCREIELERYGHRPGEQQAAE